MILLRFLFEIEQADLSRALECDECIVVSENGHSIYRQGSLPLADNLFILRPKLCIPEDQMVLISSMLNAHFKDFGFMKQTSAHCLEKLEINWDPVKTFSA